MRAFAILIAVLLAGVVLYCWYAVAGAVRGGRTRQRRRQARWRVHHYGDSGRTVVAVILAEPDGVTLDQHVVARLSDEDPDWQSQFLRARQEAEERAFHLNADRVGDGD
jgi:pyridoxamine 5'-phosphate oxidase family protein